jgi:hypothetical protein
VESIDGLIRFVNGQRDRLSKIITDHPDEERTRHTLPRAVDRFNEVTRVLTNFELLQKETVSLRAEVVALNNELKKRKSAFENLEVSPKDLHDLPPELIAQLSISESDREEFQILNVMEEAGGTLSLDQLLIAVYRKSKEILERSKLNARLYRMTMKGTLFSVPSRKGVYSIYEYQQGEKSKPAD